MSFTYTKLFGSITESTIWGEADSTRLTWITMLAMADRHGRVFASIPGLANRARVSIEDCQVALLKFLGPDPYSRTPDHQGRRIEEIDGGWRLLNHHKYRAIRDDEDERERKRKVAATRRSIDRSVSLVAGVAKDEGDSQPNPNQPSIKLVAKVAKSSDKQRQKQKQLESTSSSRDDGAVFENFWRNFPSRPGTVKAKKVATKAFWLQHGLSNLASEILEDVNLRATSDKQWLNGYSPDPLTYLRQHGWTDDKPTASASPSRYANARQPQESDRQREEAAAKLWADVGEITPEQLASTLEMIRQKYESQDTDAAQKSIEEDLDSSNDLISAGGEQ